MMANSYWNNNDPLEKRIRQTLKEWEAAPPSDWDTPSDALWQKIAPSPARGTLFPWRWILGTLAITAAIAVVLLWPETASQPPGSPPSRQSFPPALAEKENNSSLLDSKMDTLAKPPAPHANIPTPEFPAAIRNPATVAPDTRLTQAGPKPNRQAALLSNSSVTKRQADSRHATTPPVSQQPETPIADIQPAVASENETHASVETRNVLKELPSLRVPGEAIPLSSYTPVSLLSAPPVPDFISASSTPIAKLDLTSPSIRRAPRSGHFFTGLVVSPNHTFREIQSSRPTDQLPAYLKENEFAAWTTEFGARVGWKPSRRFALSTGVGLFSIRQQSLHRFRIPFDPGRERPVGNNNLEGYYNLTVPSSYGDATVEVGMQRPSGQNIPTGQFIAVEMRTDLNISYATVPLHAYYFVQAGRWSAGLKAGAALNFLQEERLDVRARIAVRGLQSRTVAVQRSTESIKRVVPDYQLGAALWYRPHLGWMLSLEPSFRHSLQPVIERESFNVSQYAWGVQVGIQKIF